MKKLIALLVILILNINCSSDSNDKAACTPIPCLNGGTSNSNCGCDCPQGFSGANCGTQITPILIKITQVKVLDFPMTDSNGNQWDQFAAGNFVRPDIYPILSLGSTILFNLTAYQDAVNTNTYTWTLSQPVSLTLSQFTSQLTLKLYDEDTGSDMEMGGYNFNIYNSTGGFPTSKIISTTSSPYKFELTLSYVW